MPLAYKSLNRGAVAFGFFHIETDLLLLNELFFFGDRFCEMVSSLAMAPVEKAFEAELKAWLISEPMDRGDLQGAIYGDYLQGFIGSLYRMHPFPRLREDFAQKPAGVLSRDHVLRELGGFALPLGLSVSTDPAARSLNIGDYDFSPPQFSQLVEYVWRGGMPGWRHGERPPYLIAMKKNLLNNPSPWLEGLDLSPDLVGVRF